MPKVSIHIVAWNSMRYLPKALESLYAQTFRDFQVILIDNASTDGVVEFLRGEYPQVVTLRNSRNLGFARGHDQAIELAKSLWEKQGGEGERYVLLTNPDIVLAPDCLERLVAAAESCPEAGAVGPKLRKASAGAEGDLKEAILTETLDTTGIRMRRTGQAVERGAGEQDLGQYDAAGEVFGVSGALCLYRLSALESVRYEGEYFDERFGSYKEDLDMAWRLRLRGWVAWYAPEALAYHFRGAYGSERRSFLTAWRERRAKSKVVNRLSYRNHIWVLVKNLDFSTFLLYSPWLLGYEFAKLVYVTFFETRTLGALSEAVSGFPEMRKRRRATMRSHKVSAKDLRKWFRA